MRASVRTRLDRLEQQVQDAQCVTYTHAEPSAAWWQEFWKVAEDSGYLPDILRALGLSETAIVG